MRPARVPSLSFSSKRSSETIEIAPLPSEMAAEQNPWNVTIEVLFPLAFDLFLLVFRSSFFTRLIDNSGA